MAEAATKTDGKSEKRKKKADDDSWMDGLQITPMTSEVEANKMMAEMNAKYGEPRTLQPSDATRSLKEDDDSDDDKDVKPKSRSRIRIDHSGRMQALVDAKADLEELDEAGNTPLMVCCNHGDAVAARILLEAGADVEAQSAQTFAATRDKPLRTPLMISVMDLSRAECVPVLLEHKADINVKNGVKMTVLHLACECACEDAVKLLLDAKADPFKVDKHGSMPIEIGRRGSGLLAIEGMKRCTNLDQFFPEECVALADKRKEQREKEDEDDSDDEDAKEKAREELKKRRAAWQKRIREANEQEEREKRAKAHASLRKAALAISVIVAVISACVSYLYKHNLTVSINVNFGSMANLTWVD